MVSFKCSVDQWLSVCDLHLLQPRGLGRPTATGVHLLVSRAGPSRAHPQQPVGLTHSLEPFLCLRTRAANETVWFLRAGPRRHFQLLC